MWTAAIWTTVLVLSGVTLTESASSTACFLNSTMESSFAFTYKYLSGSSSTNYTNSKKLCAQSHPNASLAIVRDLGTWKLLLSIRANKSSDAWIGLEQTNKTIEPAGGWFWIDDVPVEGDSTNSRYPGWGPRKPNEEVGQTEDCARFAPDGFNDESCSNTNAYFCEVNSSYCTSGCIAGTYLDNTCQICPQGTSSLIGGTITDCLECSIGRYSGNEDLWCLDCPIGKYGDVAEASSCQDCPIGKFANVSGQTDCFWCPALMSTTKEGTFSQSYCSLCPDGTGFMKGNSTQWCEPCTFGKVNSRFSCVSCDKGKYSWSTGMSVCQDCPDGRYSDLTGTTSATQCKVCPSFGVKCVNGSVLPFVLAGWFRNVETDPDMVLKCFPEEACLEGGIGSTVCNQGYSGAPCDECADDYFRLGDRCKPCLPAWGRWFIVACGIIIILYLCWRLSLVQDRVPSSFKITIQWIQFLGLYGQLSDKWPEALRSLFNLTNVLNADLQYFGFSCERSVSFWTVWLMKLVIPEVLFLCLFVATYFRVKREHGVAAFASVARTRIGGMMFMLSLLSTLIFSTLFEVFKCEEQLDGSFILRSDPSVICYTQSWYSFIGVDAIFMLMYVLVLPGVGVCFILLHRRDQRHLLEERMGPFVRPYRPGFEYWEFIRLWEKLVFVILRDTVVVDKSSMVMILLVVLMTQVILDVNCRPFKEERANRISFHWNMLCLVTLVSQFVFSSGSTELMKNLVTGVIVTLFFLLLAENFWRYCRGWRRGTKNLPQRQTEKPISVPPQVVLNSQWIQAKR